MQFLSSLFYTICQTSTYMCDLKFSSYMSKCTVCTIMAYWKKASMCAWRHTVYPKNFEDQKFRDLFIFALKWNFRVKIFKVEPRGNSECTRVTESKYFEDDIFEVEDKSSKTSKFLILEIFRLYGTSSLVSCINLQHMQKGHLGFKCRHSMCRTSAYNLAVVFELRVWVCTKLYWKVVAVRV